MQVSDWINVVLCVLSFFLAAISVVTVVITLKQNHKMIQNSTRPYIVAMAQLTNFQNPFFYLVVKNFGASGATILEMTCSIALNEVSFSDRMTPFDNIEGTFLAPGQKIYSCLHSDRFDSKGIKDFIVHLKYSDGIKVYEEECPINYRAYIENVGVRADTNNAELKIISYTLQDLVEKEF